MAEEYRVFCQVLTACVKEVLRWSRRGRSAVQAIRYWSLLSFAASLYRDVDLCAVIKNALSFRHLFATRSVAVY